MINLAIHIVYGLLFATRGDGSQFPRPLWLAICFTMAYGVTADLYDALAYLYIFAVMGCLPTNALMSCVHGKLPDRPDGKWQFMQDLAMKITRRLPSRYGYWDFGIVYAAIPASWTLPAIIWLGNYWLLLLLLQGVVVFFLGRISQKWALRVCEFWTGFVV